MTTEVLQMQLSMQLRGCAWEVHLPFVLFLYHTSPHESTGEYHFLLLSSHDPKLPTNLSLNQPMMREDTDLDSYKGDVAT